MSFTFDPEKDRENIAKHGISLAKAKSLDWDSAVEVEDTRREYGEVRKVAVGLIGNRVHVAVYTPRDGGRRMISLRKANQRETKSYANKED